ncbi:MAG: hypothetical protein JST46_15695 [Bacteroidetes bacterium]|nr:hypothetical protein [Bacteroidota bacterium]
MIRKIVAIIVLFSVVMHLSARTGLLAQLYKNRYEIVHKLGLYGELSISECGSSYYADQQLVLPSEHQDESIPPVLTHVSEITLFFKAAESLNSSSMPLLLRESNTHYLTGFYETPGHDFFQPPRC